VILIRGPRASAEPPEGVEVIGPLGSLVELLAAADLVVCGAGGTMVEACAAGVPAAVTVLAPNQAPIARALERAGAVVRIDDAEPEAAVAALGGDRARRAELTRAARAAVDGRGADRVAAAIERLAG
jgi:spore coat polysaccharide biosynthesis predicted glycosyltransferase SpsG